MTVSDILQLIGLLGILVIAVGIGLVHLPIVGAGVFLIAAPEVIGWLHRRGNKK